MRHSQVVSAIAKKTGLPSRLVVQVLDAQSELLRYCLKTQQEVPFPRLFKLGAGFKTYIDRPTKRKVKRITLRVRPVRSFRKELNEWSVVEKE